MNGIFIFMLAPAAKGDGQIYDSAKTYIVALMKK